MTDGHAMTAGVQVKPTEALTRRTARKFAISNFLILAVVLLAFIVVLNVWSYMYSYGHIDARSNYQVQTFIDEHQSAEDHTYGLSKSFIPVLYIKTADGELLNLEELKLSYTSVEIGLPASYPLYAPKRRIMALKYNINSSGLCQAPFLPDGENFYGSAVRAFPLAFFAVPALRLK